MNDMREYLRNFFEGPFPSRMAAIRGAAQLHGEKSLVVGPADGFWWARPWREENFIPGSWPEGFESVSRFDVGVATLPRLKLDRLNDVDDVRVLLATNMAFANWRKGERVAPMAGSRYDFRLRPE